MSADARPRSVIHVATNLDYGGVESHMAMLAELQAACAYAHSYCAMGEGGRVEGFLRARGAQVVCLRAKTRIPSMPAIWRLYRLFRRERPHVVHTHGAEANFHGLIAAGLAGVPIRVGEEIGIPTHGRLARLVFALTYRAADRVIGVSQSVTDWLIANGEVKVERGVTLLNPVRLPAGRSEVPHAAIGPEEVELRACFVGRLEPVKNLVALVEAFGRLIASGARAELWLIGEGSLREMLGELVRELRLQEVVKFQGYQSDPAKWLRQCHVCIQPSISEGFGLALVEAMGCEVPVISTYVGAAPVVIEDGVTGWLVDGFDAGSIHAVLDRAYRTPSTILLAMGRAARLKVAKLFEPEVYLNRLEGLYDAIATKQSFK